MNHSKQHALWLLAAIGAPIAHIAGLGWFQGAAAALVILPLALIPQSWEMPKPLAILEILWLGIITGLLLPGSAAYWPSDNTFVVPLTILFLASVTGAAEAPRIGALLAFCMSLLAIPMAISAASRIEVPWLKPYLKPWPQELTIALLIPALPATGREKRGGRLIAAGMLTILLCGLVQGVIGRIDVDDPFYQTARTLGHMEPVAAVGVTLGWYALACLMIRSASIAAEKSGIAAKWSNVLVVGTTAALILFPQQPHAWIVSGISLFLWVIVPLLTKIKNFEKTQK